MSTIQVSVESKLAAAFPNSEINVVDVSGGCGQSFQIQVKSDQFKGQKMLKQHRMVKSAIKEEMNDIHAVTLTTSS